MEITNISLRGIIDWVQTLFFSFFSDPTFQQLFNINRIVKTVRSLKDENDIFTKIEYFDRYDILVRESTLSGGTTPTYTYRTERDFDEYSNLISTKYFLQRYDVDNVWISEEPTNEIE
jgi:hypothetical protein